MLDKKQKLELYNGICEQLAFGIYPMAKVCLAIRDAGHSCKEYGYIKSKPMILELPEFFELLTEGRPITEPDIRFFEWVDAVLPDSHKAAPDKEAFPERVRPFLDQPLHAWVFYPMKNLELLREKTGMERETLQRLLDTDFAAARGNGALRHYEEKLNFPLSVSSVNGNPLFITLKEASEGRGSDKPWFFSYIYEDMAAKREDGTAPGKMLEHFAFLGSWSSFLGALSQMALPECWAFGGVKGDYWHFEELYPVYLCPPASGEQDMHRG